MALASEEVGSKIITAKNIFRDELGALVNHKCDL